MLLDRLVWCNQAGWIVGPEEVPGVEAGEVLESSKELITANWK